MDRKTKAHDRKEVSIAIDEVFSLVINIDKNMKNLIQERITQSNNQDQQQNTRRIASKEVDNLEEIN